MFSNIKEIYLENSIKEYVSIPKKDFMEIYDELTIEYAQQLVSMYFLSLSKMGFGRVLNIIEDIDSAIIKIELELEDKIKGESV